VDTKIRKIIPLYNGGKTFFSINGAEKMGHLHVKK